MLQAAKCGYKDFEPHFEFSRFQFYLHFPWGLQSAEGWPAEKISKLNWIFLGEKKGNIFSFKTDKQHQNLYITSKLKAQ